MQDFINKKIVVGVCGGIAAYKSAYLVRELVRYGAQVRVVMTNSAQQFISPLTFQALSGHEVRMEGFDQQAERAMGHIELGRWADYLLIAPASANSLAKMANGIADDLLTTLYLVCEAPVIVCPAMNRSMWTHPATQKNIAILKHYQVMIVGPEEGSQACGEEGLGRISEVDAIINALRLFDINQILRGKKILITAGATQEAIDPVRFLSNRSSGKMGYGLAEAANAAGAAVTLISGPSSLTAPYPIQVCRVQSAQQMYDAVMEHLKPGIIFIGAAAVADYTIASPASEKLKKQAQQLTLMLQPTQDIVAAVAASGQASYVVGFAAETSQLIDNARAKLQAKKLNMIIANQVGQQLGFEQDYNRVTVITNNKQIDLKLTHKTRLAGQIIAILAANLQNGAS